MITLCYKGRCELKDDSLGHEYYLMNGTGLDASINEGADTRVFAKKLCACQPGGVFTINEPEGKEDSSVSLGTDEYLGQIKNKDLVIKLQVESRALEAAHEEAKATKKLMERNEVLIRLAPIKEAYQNSVPKVRRQILAEILRYITT